MNQAAAVRVGKADLDLVTLDRGQSIQKVIDVEADLDFLALVRHLDLVLGFLLLGVVSLEGEEIRPGGQTDAAVLLVGQDRRALQGLAQSLTIGLDCARRGIAG